MYSKLASASLIHSALIGEGDDCAARYLHHVKVATQAYQPSANSSTMALWYTFRMCHICTHRAHLCSVKHQAAPSDRNLRIAHRLQVLMDLGTVLARQRPDQGEGLLSVIIVVAVSRIPLLAHNCQVLMAIVVHQPPLLPPPASVIMRLLLPALEEERPGLLTQCKSHPRKRVCGTVRHTEGVSMRLIKSILVSKVNLSKSTTYCSLSITSMTH